ncbi:MAG: hypothetical protein RQ753_09405, partial [Desulfurivibrionaceae bacterium]|nr:hypothetical protein [Desulfurivibrionaceae bacterium]
AGGQPAEKIVQADKTRPEPGGFRLPPIKPVQKVRLNAGVMTEKILQANPSAAKLFGQGKTGKLPVPGALPGGPRLIFFATFKRAQGIFQGKPENRFDNLAIDCVIPSPRLVRLRGGLAGNLGQLLLGNLSQFPVESRLNHIFFSAFP